MGLQRMTLESQNAMNAVDGATIERRIRISRPDEGRARCKGSRAWDPRKDFSQCMQQPRILSTSNVILPRQERTGPSGRRPCRHGVKSSLLRNPEVPGDLLRAIFGNVTEPYRFDWRPTPEARLGACHIIEMPFVFNYAPNWAGASMLAVNDPPSFQKLAMIVQGEWLSFIRTGKPGGSGLPTWPARNAAHPQSLI